MSKVIKLMPTLSDKKTAVSIAHDIESHGSRYLLTITIINTCLGLCGRDYGRATRAAQPDHVGSDGRRFECCSLSRSAHRNDLYDHRRRLKL